jgi:DNA-binding protein HU-beta
MNKTELVSKVAELTEGTKVESGKYLDAFIKVVTDALVESGEVNITGFGKFATVETKEKTGTIQLGERKGESYTTPAHIKPTFKYGSNIKNLLKEK